MNIPCIYKKEPEKKSGAVKAVVIITAVVGAATLIYLTETAINLLTSLINIIRTAALSAMTMMIAISTIAVILRIATAAVTPMMIATAAAAVLPPLMQMMQIKIPIPTTARMPSN